MLGLTANIAFLFPDRTFLDRIDAAKSAGFDSVECHFPYDLPIPVIKERLDAVGVRLTGLGAGAKHRIRLAVGPLLAPITSLASRIPRCLDREATGGWTQRPQSGAGRCGTAGATLRAGQRHRL